MTEKEILESLRIAIKARETATEELARSEDEYDLDLLLDELEILDRRVAYLRSRMLDRQREDDETMARAAHTSGG